MDLEAASLCDLLMHIVLDENKDPTNLPIWLLKSLTNNFSDDQHIGHGGFADVYKGDLQNGIIIAVKKLKPSTSEMVEVNETKFNQEVDSLMKVNHKNIVKFLGYCSDTQGEVQKLDGKNIMAEKRQRFLCFEFLKEGSLDKYISDASEGLGWRTRYKIIRGICEGLHYLHSKKIVHSDLKPANILLDHKMVPKISDFGLARTFDEQQTRAITKMVFGSSRYMAPESFHGVITFKSDIYSLGVIIREILEGPGPKVDLSIDNVLRVWSTRLQNLWEGTWLEHVRVCAEIGLQCVDYDQMKGPSMEDIIKKLDELEHTHGSFGTDDDDDDDNDDHLLEKHFVEGLDMHPLKVCFPWEAKRCIKCPVSLTNTTNNDVWVWITPTYRYACPSSGVSFPYFWELQSEEAQKGSTLFLTLKSHSSKTILMAMMEQQQRPLQKHYFDVVMFVTTSWWDPRHLRLELTGSDDSLNRIQEIGTVLYQATLSAVTYYLPRDLEVAVTPVDVVTKKLMKMKSLVDISCMDVHPIETWVLVGHGDGKVSIWNYQTQELVMLSVVYYMYDDAPRRNVSMIESVKFITGEQWFAAAGFHGSVHVRSYNTNDKIMEFKAHSGDTVAKIAVQPTNNILLIAVDRSIKLWDWGQGWECVGVYNTHADVIGLRVGPRNPSTFASLAVGGIIQVWGFHSSDSIAAFRGDISPDFYTDSNGHFLATSTHTTQDKVKIWDMQTVERVHTLVVSGMSIRNIVCHPTLPILATITSDESADGSENLYILLWYTRTYRLLKSVEIHMDNSISIYDIVFDGTEDLIRIIVRTSHDKISIIETNLAPTLKMDISTVPVVEAN